jgi:sulfotransferase
MTARLSFISGLPRSGSTMLAAILRQNPAFHAGMSSPLLSIFSGLLRSMGPGNEYARFLSDGQRERMIRAVFDQYFAEFADKHLVFDTNRGWSAHLASLASLFPESRVICCVRNPAWILDSIERRVQSAGFSRSRMFPDDAAENVYTRVEFMLKKGILSGSMQALRQAWYGEHADRLIAVRYDSITERPTQLVERLYELLREPPFRHDFENLEYNELEFDEQLGLPGLHEVKRRVERIERTTVLPTDLFAQNDRCFWDVPGQNPRGVIVL